MIGMLRFVCVVVLMVGQQVSVAAPVDGNAKDADTLLEAVLQVRYPMVTEWRLSPVNSMQHKRRPQLVSEPTAGAAIHRDGSLFAVQTGQTVSTHYRVAGYQPVWVAGEYLAKGTALQSEHLLQQSRDVFLLGCEPLSGDASLVDIRLRRAIKANEVLCRTDMESLPLVSRSQHLLIRCGSGSVTISAAGVALSDGQLGQQIQVRRAGANNTLLATIVDQGEVDACI